MRIGTFWCFLWGHKFTKQIYSAEYGFAQYHKIKTNFCIQCGKEKE